MSRETTNNTQIRIRPETRQRFNAIKAAKGWTIAETAERASLSLSRDVEREHGRSRRSRQPQAAS